MAKKAVFVGCNYPGADDNELQGCVNDVRDMYKMLVGKFGFAKEDMVVLDDTSDYFQRPTGTNIRRALDNMVQGAKAGDTFFFHFSGHGARIPPDDGEVDDTGFDECICPSDFDIDHLIRDNYFRELISELPFGTTFTIVADSSHSGGLIDGAKEQIGNSYEKLPEEEAEPDPDAWMEGEADSRGERRTKNKELSTEALVQIWRKKLGREDIDLSSLRSTLEEIYSSSSSSRSGDRNKKGAHKKKKSHKKKKATHDKKKKKKKKKKSDSSSDEGSDDDSSSSSSASSSSSSDSDDDDIMKKKAAVHKKKKSDRKKHEERRRRV